MKECQGYIEGYSAEESVIYLQERASELGVDISGCTLDNITPIADKCTPTRVRKAWKIARKDKYTKPNCIYCLDCGLVGYDVFTLHKKPITDNAPARFLMLHTVVERSKTGHEKVIASFPKKLPAERLASSKIMENPASEYTYFVAKRPCIVNAGSDVTAVFELTKRRLLTTNMKCSDKNGTRVTKEVRAYVFYGEKLKPLWG